MERELGARSVLVIYPAPLRFLSPLSFSRYASRVQMEGTYVANERNGRTDHCTRGFLPLPSFTRESRSHAGYGEEHRISIVSEGTGCL